MNDDREITPAFVQRLLRARYPDVAVLGVELVSAHDGSASRVRLRITYVAGADCGLPADMFLKRNLAVFNFPSEMYSTEVRIYRDVLPGLGLEQPTVFAIESGDDDIRFNILMEDLGTRPGARLGIVTDTTTIEEVSGLLDSMAQLHAQFWANDSLENLTWLAPAPQHAAMLFWRQHGPRLARRHMEAGHRAPLVDRDVWTDDVLWDAFDRMLDCLDSGPHTLLHGDVHAGNVYYVDGNRGGLIDWQLSLRGCWALDFAYLMITALDPEQQATHETTLLRRYLAALADRGVEPPPFDQAWLLYRQHVIYGVAM